MELLVNKKNNKVFTFNGNLGSCVWEPKPVTRFRFKTPTENDWVKERLLANYPTCGIVFAGTPYIGTSDGFVVTPHESIQRIPEIFVDSELFIDEYPFADDVEREVLREFRKGNYNSERIASLASKDAGLVKRIFDIDKLVANVAHQERRIDNYLFERFGRLSIRGFVVNKLDQWMETLYDGHLLGITETKTGKVVNELTPQMMYQINSSKAGFVPVDSRKTTIQDGIIKESLSPCVDYRSLWTLDGQSRLVEGICPRDGSGGSPAKFATDVGMYGGTTAISHGNCPWYSLDIKVRKNSGGKEDTRIELDKHDLPRKIIIKDGSVFAFYKSKIVNHSVPGADVEFDREITSISDSGLCTFLEDDGKTCVRDAYNFTGIGAMHGADHLDGEYVFLSSAPQ